MTNFNFLSNLVVKNELNHVPAAEKKEVNCAPADAKRLQIAGGGTSQSCALRSEGTQKERSGRTMYKAQKENTHGAELFGYHGAFIPDGHPTADRQSCMTPVGDPRGVKRQNDHELPLTYPLFAPYLPLTYTSFDTRSSVSRQSDVATRVWKYVACMLMVLVLAIGQMWGAYESDPYVTVTAKDTIHLVAKKSTLLFRDVSSKETLSTGAILYGGAYQTSAQSKDWTVNISSNPTARKLENYDYWFVLYSPDAFVAGDSIVVGSGYNSSNNYWLKFMAASSTTYNTDLHSGSSIVNPNATQWYKNVDYYYILPANFVTSNYIAFRATGGTMYYKYIKFYHKAVAPSCTAPNHVDVTGRWDRFAGETISLTATAYSSAGTGSPIAAGSITGYQWQKLVGSTWTSLSDGTTDGVTISGATSANLQIANCGGDNSGKYRCVVSTGATCSTASATATDGSQGYLVRVYTLEHYTGGTTVHNFTRINETSGSVQVDLTANTSHEFKIHGDVYFGNNGTITEDETTWTFTEGANNVHVQTYTAGKFIFTIDYSANGAVPVLKVAYPTRRLYLQLCSDWKAATAKYAIYYWRSANGWSDFMSTDACDGDIRYADIPSWAQNIIAVRFNPSKASTGNWDDEWNRTGDLALAYDKDYYHTVSKGDDNKYYGTWGTYSPTTYTVTAAPSTVGYGTVSAASVTGVACGTSISASTNTLTVGTTNVTAAAASATAEYTYAFDNWTWTPAGATVTSDVTATANFTRTPKSYTLTWVTDGDALTGTYTSGSVAYGTTITQPDTPTKTGYNFSAWSPSVASTMPAANTTYTATWTAKTTTITINANTANHGSTTPGTVTATYGSALPSFTTAVGVSGYSLTGYFTEATSGTKIINADGTLVASTGYADGDGKWKSEAATLTLFAQYEEEAGGGCTYRSINAATTTDLGSTEVPRYVVNVDGIGRLMKNKTGSSAWSVGDNGALQTGSSIFALQTYNAINEIIIYGTGTGNNRTLSKIEVGSATSNYEEITVSATTEGTDDGKFTSSSAADSMHIVFEAAANSYVAITFSGNVYISKVTFVSCDAASCSAPAAPTGFTAGSITSTGATFSITDGGDAASYDIYYSTSSTAPNASTVATTTSTEKTKAVTGLTANTTYYAWVRSVCDASHKSDWVALTGSSFTTSAAETPIITWEMKLTSSQNWGLNGDPSTTDNTNITSISANNTHAAQLDGKTANGTMTAGCTTAQNGTARDNNIYVEFKFHVGCDKKLTPSKISLQVSNIGGSSDGNMTYDAILTDGTRTVSGSVTPASDGTLTTLEFTNADASKYMQGDVTLRVYPYNNNGGNTGSGFRMGQYVKIFGEIANQATPAATITWNTQPANGTVGDEDFAYDVTCSDGSTVTVTSANTTYATIVGGKLHYAAAGTTHLVATATDACGNVVVQNSSDFTVSAAAGHTVTYKYNGADGGSRPASATGASVTLPTPTRADYKLDGWYTTDGTRINDGGATYNPTADITLYARWEEECDAGGVAKSTADVAATGYTAYQEKGGSNVVFTAAPSLGFKYKDAAGGTIDGSTTAQARNNAYSCQIKSDSGNKGSIKTNSTFSNVDSISFYFAASDKSGCKIAVWYSTDNFSTDSTSLLSATTYGDSNGEFKRKTLAIPSEKKASTLTFKFRFTVTGAGKTCYMDSLKVYSSTTGGSTCYHVYYHGNGAESGYVNDTVSYTDGSKATVLNYNYGRYPLAKAGYDFQGWATSADGAVAYTAGEKITIDGADVHLYAVWATASTALVTWKMQTANDEAWATTTGTGTTDGTNISSIGTSHDEGDNKAKNSATAKTALASSPSNVDKGADFTFAIGSTMQVEINKLDCQVFNVGGDNDGQTTYKAQISDAAGNVYTSTNSVCPANDATLTDASFVFGSGKILRGAVTIRVYGWVSGSGSWTDFRMGPDIKFYGTVEDYVCATPSAPTISGVSEYVPGQTITLTASHDGENYDNLTTYTWYKGDTWGSKSQVQAAATGSAGYTFTKASCEAGDAGKYWCEVANGTCNAHNSEGYNIIVYPTYTITYNLNGGTNPVDPAPKTSYTQFDEDYTLPTPTKTGSVFAGWYGASDFSGLPTVVLGAGSVGDKEYWAKWATDYTISWTDPASDPKLGGGGYTVTGKVATWTGTLTTSMISTTTSGVTITNVTVDNSASPKTITATFNVGASVEGDAVTFVLDVPAAGIYGAKSDSHDVDIDRCTGSAKEIRFLSANKNDAGSNFADMSTSSNTTQYVGSGIAKLIATGSCGLNDADKKIGYRSDRLNVVFKLTATTALDIYFNAGSTGKTLTLYSFSSDKALSDIGTSDYSSKTTVTSGVSVTGAAFASSSHTTTSGTASLSSGVVSITAQGGVKISYSSLAAGYYVLTGSSDGYLYGFDASGGSGSGSITPTLTWDDGDDDIATTGIAINTSDDDFTYEAVQNQNSLGAITYSSSNTSVATVNATTGKVHIVGAAGNATITATIAASGCYNSANVSYTITVTDNCDDEAGTIETVDLGCSGIQMTITGHTAAAGVSYQWYKDGVSLGSADGAQTATYTATAAGEYYVIVTNSGDRHCAKRSTNTIVLEAKAAATATKIVDEWYVKNGRRTPDVELVQTTNAVSFKVQNGSSTVIWNTASGSEVTTGFGGCGFHLGDNGIIYLNGTTEEDGSGDAASGLTAGDETLTITVYGCDNNVSQEITIHKQAATDYKSIAFVVDGTKGGAWDAVTSGHADGTELYEYLDSVGTAAGKRQFQLTERNIYSTTDEKAIRQHYSQFDAILITDDPSTNTVAKSGDDYKTKGYVNAFGTMVDVRPILTMEAFVSALANWKTKGIAGTPDSPNPRQYAIRLECKDHEIYKAGLPEAEDGTNVWEEVIGSETYRYVIMVDSTKGVYNGVAYNVETAGNKKPALQGFDGTASGSLLGLGRILDGSLQAAIERQEEPAARLLVFGINALALRPTSALTDEGKQVIANILTYLLKTNMEEVDDCSNYFTGKNSTSWSDPGNWSKKSLPSTEAKVRILAPCVISGIQPHVLQVSIVNSGNSNIRNTARGSAVCDGTLTIEPDGALIADGKIRSAVAPHFAANDLMPTTPEMLTINTRSDAQAALIFNNEEGLTKATVNLYSLGRNDGSYKYQYFAIPMEYVSVSPTFANETHGGTKIYTYVYNEASSGWTRRGYYDDLYAFEGLGITTKSTVAMNYTMTGTLASTATKEITLTHDDAGLNLIGNSWMAPIQIGALAEDNTDANITKTVYIYCAGRDAEGGALSGDTETAGQWLAVPFEAASFATWIETGKLSVIPAMQAFQIKTAAEATLTLDYDKVVRGSTNDLNAKLRAPRRREDAQEDEVTLSILRVADSKTHTDISLFEGGWFSDEFDNGWEAEYINSDGRSAQFYAMGVNGKMAVLATNELEGTKVGFEPGQEREYTIRVMGSGISYYLNDLKEKKSMLISEGNTYSFTYEEGDEANRFLISGTPFEAPQTPTGVGQAPSDQVQGTKVQKVIYQDKVYIIRGGKIYDIVGKVVK